MTTRFLDFRRTALGLALLSVVALAYLAGRSHGPAAPAGEGGGAAGGAAAAPAAPSLWTCSMHPQIKLPKPGQCPICGMDLIPLEEDTGSEEPAGPRTLVLSEAAAALAEIATAPVTRAPAAAEVRLEGVVTYDESRYREITAWVAGRLDTVWVDTTGQRVRRGQPLVSIYSPRLYAAQTELLAAAAAAADPGGTELMRTAARRTLAAARERLRQWGLPAAWIAGVERSGVARDHVTIPAPAAGVVLHRAAVEGAYVRTGTPLYRVADLDEVWVDLEAFETDLPVLRPGQAATFTTVARPGRTWEGRIVFIDPVLDPRTRTATVRLAVANRDGALLPDMFVHGVVRVELDAHGRPAAPDAEPPLTIPATAPLITGTRAVVYVRDPGDQPRFTGREVVLGPRAGDRYVVLEGLQEGERVVTRGNFKIDSALQIQARPSMMNPTGGGPSPGHQHGGGGGVQAPAPAGAAEGAAAGGGDHAAAAPGAGDPRAAAALAPVIRAYLDLQQALAGDDEPDAARAAAALSAALADVPMAAFGDGHAFWMERAAGLKSAVAAVRDAEGLEARRRAFAGLTGDLWAVLERFGAATGDTLRRFHCPMYGDGGADWIQTAPETANPFYGAAMLRCGDQQAALPPVRNDREEAR